MNQLNQDDAFFRTNIFSNYGDLCTAVKDLLNNFQKQHQSAETLETETSIERVQELVDKFPALKKNFNEVRSALCAARYVNMHRVLCNLCRVHCFVCCMLCGGMCAVSCVA